MDKIKKFWYDEDIENINKYLHLIILDLERRKLEKLLKLDISERDDKFVKTYYERTKDLNDDEYFILNLDDNSFNELKKQVSEN